MGSNKRAPLPYRTDRTKNFEKAWKRYNKSGRYDMQAAAVAMNLVTNRNPVPAEYPDHELTGEWDGFRELHIGGIFYWFIASMKKTRLFISLTLVRMLNSLNKNYVTQ